MKIRELEKRYIEQLSPLYGADEARSIAWLAFSHILKFSRIEYLNSKNDDLLASNEHRLSLILEKLKTGMPLQYVLGETEFYGLPFKVDPSVLIPRPETEELVHWMLQELTTIKMDDPVSILDIGTGSGCIPIALKKNLPQANVSGIDISGSAIKTALENAKLNEVAVTFLQKDIFELIVDRTSVRYSVIVSNPPYVTTSEKKLMHKNVLNFEPHSALFVSDEDPLVFYKAIAQYARLNLSRGGLLFFEINENLGNETKAVLEEEEFTNIELRKDLRGRERMIRAVIN